MKKKKCFFMAVTSNIGFAAGNVALALNRHAQKRDFDIVIFNNGLDLCDELAFQSLSNVELRHFSLPADFAEEMLKKLPSESRFITPNKLMCFAHFEAFSLLSEYQTVVWLDADIAIQDDISALLDSGPLAMTLDFPWKVKDNFKTEISTFDMQREGFCTAVMVVNDSLPYMLIYRWLYDAALKYASLLLNPDQAIINLAIQEFNLEVESLPLDVWQCISWKEVANVAKIVHFGTERKVWNDPLIAQSFPEWVRDSLRWESLGGSNSGLTLNDTRNTYGTLMQFLRYESILTSPTKYLSYMLGRLCRKI